VIFDLMKKLRANTQVLEILGDGKQRRSYLDLIAGPDGIFYGHEDANERYTLFNLGRGEFSNVLDLRRWAGSGMYLFIRVTTVPCLQAHPRCWKTHLVGDAEGHSAPRKGDI
jgi:nucleoside-diphosphate-sugar epimerase